MTPPPPTQPSRLTTTRAAAASTLAVLVVVAMVAPAFCITQVILTEAAVVGADQHPGRMIAAVAAAARDLAGFERHVEVAYPVVEVEITTGQHFCNVTQSSAIRGDARLPERLLDLPPPRI